jgi:hypothetical protein
MFDFPANPSIGQPFVVSGITYIFDGVAWNVSAAPNAALPLTADSRNRIRNPNMIVSQENGDTASVVAGYYVADQWQSNWSAGGGGQAGAGRVTTTPPSGSTYSFHQYVNVADATPTGWMAISQSIEGTDIADFRWGSAVAKQAVLRFWANSSAAGTYGGCVRSIAPGPARTFPFSFTLAANTWTEVVKVIPGDTGGTAWTSTNTKAGEVFFTWAAATAQRGTPGVWQDGGMFGATGQSNGFGVVANHFYVTDIGLYLDPLGTGIPPRWEAPDFNEEYIRCQRYYEAGRNYWDGYAAASTAVSVTIPFRVGKRAVVTATASLSGTVNSTGGTCDYLGTTQFRYWRSVTATGSAAWSMDWIANARM